jgi:predicted amidohydrolase
MGSFVERAGPDLFNTAVLLDPRGEVAGRYRKIHLFGFGDQESRLLRRGEGVTVVPTPFGKIGLSICYDLRFPELYRQMLDQGAAIFLVTSAWPRSRRDAWVLFNRARAHENLAYLFSCNCAGVQADHEFGGHSLFVDPLGKVIAEAGDDEMILSAEIDPGAVDRVRREFHVLRDRVIR